MTMQVLLVAPSFEDPRFPLYLPSEHLGLGYLASVLRNAGVSVEILDANMLGLKAPANLAAAKAEAYDVVGVSVPFQTAVDESFRVVSAAKELWPSSHICVGGHFPTFKHQEILRSNSEVDSVVRGDGEETFLDLVERLSSNSSLDAVLGLSFRRGSQVVANPPRPTLADLDSLPWPARDSLHFVRRHGHPWPTQISSSRGCFANCDFCDIRSFYSQSWRARTPKALVDEIQYLVETFGSRIFRFTDDEFIGPRGGGPIHGPRRAEAIAHELISRSLDIGLMIDARAEAVQPELFKLLRKAGAFDCLVGVESGVERILRLYTKGATVAKNLEAISVLRDLDIRLNLGFIMFDPRMTFDELLTNYRFLTDNNITTVNALRSYLWPLYGTLIVPQLEGDGLVVSRSLGDLEYRFRDPRVGKIFDSVRRCARITFEFDWSFYQARKTRTVGSHAEASLERAYLEVWTEVFIQALNRRRGKVRFDFVEKSVVRLLDALGESSQQVTKGRRDVHEEPALEEEALLST